MTESLPLVSVMVPAYQHEAFIAECLDSIVSQDYPALEIVVSDDASRDRTPDILRDYAARYPQVHALLNETNAGVSANCNRSLERCSGKYVALFAGDDLMLPGKLRAQVDFMEAHPECVISYHDLEIFDTESGSTLRYFNHGPGSFTPFEGGAEVLVAEGTFCGGCSLMVRRSAIPPRLYDLAVPFGPDNLFVIGIGISGTIRYINRVLGRYRKHRGGLTRRPIALDELITLGLVDERYPHLRPYSRQRRLARFHRLGVKALLQRQFRVGALHLVEYARALLRLPPGELSYMLHPERRGPR
jgi:glycosyltransferase involved in cell wall biosynthesis